MHFLWRETPYYPSRNPLVFQCLDPRPIHIPPETGFVRKSSTKSAGCLGNTVCFDYTYIYILPHPGTVTNVTRIISFFVGNPDWNLLTFICDCYWLGGGPKLYVVPMFLAFLSRALGAKSDCGSSLREIPWSLRGSFGNGWFVVAKSPLAFLPHLNYASTVIMRPSHPRSHPVMFRHMRSCTDGP